MSAPTRPLVLGVGNPFRRDDGVGPAVVAALDGRGDADVAVLDGEPARLLEAWSGRALVVVVDAVRTGAAPGTLHRLEVGTDAQPGWATAGGTDALPGWEAAGGTHGAGLAEAVGVGAALGRLPGRIVVVGVEAGELGDGPGLSAPVADAVEAAAALVLDSLEEVRPCA